MARRNRRRNTRTKPTPARRRKALVQDAVRALQLKRPAYTRRSTWDTYLAKPLAALAPLSPRRAVGARAAAKTVKRLLALHPSTKVENRRAPQERNTNTTKTVLTPRPERVFRANRSYRPLHERSEFGPARATVQLSCKKRPDNARKETRKGAGRSSRNFVPWC